MSHCLSGCLTTSALRKARVNSSMYIIGLLFLQADLDGPHSDSTSGSSSDGEGALGSESKKKKGKKRRRSSGGSAGAVIEVEGDEPAQLMTMQPVRPLPACKDASFAWMLRLQTCEAQCYVACRVVGCKPRCATHLCDEQPWPTGFSSVAECCIHLFVQGLRSSCQTGGKLGCLSAPNTS